MNKLLPALTIAFAFFQMTLLARDPGWLERRMGELDRTLLISDEEERALKVGKFLGVATKGAMDPQQREIFDKAQSSLLAIPGHATFYQEKLESMRAESVENAKKTYDEIRRLRNEGTAVEHAEYEDFRQYAFGVLGLLPSPQAVAVLGHFLNDPEDRNIKQRGDVLAFPPNCGAAARALNKLGIENPPNKNVATDPRWSEFDLREVDAWNDWWHEVKAGKRTYRFIGSDVEYGPDGPASKEVIERVGRDRKRDEERANGHPKVSTASESAPIGPQIRKPSTIAAVMAACALVGAAVWCFLKRRGG